MTKNIFLIILIKVLYSLFFKMLNLDIQDRNSKLISQDIDDDLVVQLESELQDPPRQKALDEAIQN